ncbi:MAG TPA: SMP-30/gluconolactonase/LRE family protein [Egibacteraceae bacterium]|nr:SMP-30/gluconolactonase/LRE family protein [Egibacteraceae bacterium]
MQRRTRWAAVLLLFVALVAVAPAWAQERPFGDTQVFARVGQPGQPEGIAVDSRGRVYVSTNNRGKGGPGPSKIFRYSPAGRLEREYVAEGQNLAGEHGLLGIAIDAADRLYVMDYDPARVLRFHPETGAQETYATIPNLPACGPGAAPDGSCEPGAQDTTPWPNWPVFDADGNLFLTDLHQATIWKIAAGGGVAQPWHQSADYESVFSLNGIQFDRRDGSLVYVLTGGFNADSPARGVIHRLAVNPDGTPGERITVFQTLPGEGPDGLALGESGRIYVALVTSSHILVLEPDGTEVARVPDPVSNRTQQIPYDAPASVAFRGTSILVTNHSYFTANPESWAVLDMAVGEVGMALHHPAIGGRGAPQAPPATPSTPVPRPAGELPASGPGPVMPVAGLVALAMGVSSKGLTRTPRTHRRPVS